MFAAISQKTLKSLAGEAGRVQVVEDGNIWRASLQATQLRTQLRLVEFLHKCGPIHVQPAFEWLGRDR